MIMNWGFCSMLEINLIEMNFCLLEVPCMLNCRLGVGGNEIGSAFAMQVVGLIESSVDFAL